MNYYHPIIIKTYVFLQIVSVSIIYQKCQLNIFNWNVFIEVIIKDVGGHKKDCETHYRGEGFLSCTRN